MTKKQKQAFDIVHSTLTDRRDELRRKAWETRTLLVVRGGGDPTERSDMLNAHEAAVDQYHRAERELDMVKSLHNKLLSEDELMRTIADN
jgi:hypothetical protein